MKDQPSYFAIIPAKVRYSKIPDRAKLLYGEITALSNREGYCFASNSYFAELYGCTPQAISKHLGILESAGFIRTDHNKDAGNLRKIYPVMDIPYQPTVDTPINQGFRPYQPTVEHNNTINNKDSIGEIVQLLNTHTKSTYRASTEATKKSINARLKEGYTVQDFEKVILTKARQWMGSDMEKFLRPATLFSPSHFEAYLNEAQKNEQVQIVDLAQPPSPEYQKYLDWVKSNCPIITATVRYLSRDQFGKYQEMNGISRDAQKRLLTTAHKDLETGKEPKAKTVWDAYIIRYNSYKQQAQAI